MPESATPPAVHRLVSANKRPKASSKIGDDVEDGEDGERGGDYWVSGQVGGAKQTVAAISAPRKSAAIRAGADKEEMRARMDKAVAEPEDLDPLRGAGRGGVRATMREEKMSNGESIYFPDSDDEEDEKGIDNSDD